jgi:hypothetical protein
MRKTSADPWCQSTQVHTVKFENASSEETIFIMSMLLDLMVTCSSCLSGWLVLVLGEIIMNMGEYSIGVKSEDLEQRVMLCRKEGDASNCMSVSTFS